ncbi:hypothetical protein [Streptosporangium sp. NPDC002524]|uniref:hypothetical protein n=1 Tax=Streptosporangium sp. NPDC002524 TaxID=3154537 RepID=UPI0033287C6F
MTDTPLFDELAAKAAAARIAPRPGWFTTTPDPPGLPGPPAGLHRAPEAAAAVSA